MKSLLEKIDQLLVNEKKLSDIDLKVGSKFKLPNGETIEIKRKFKENYGEDWVEFNRSGGSAQQGKNEGSVKQLLIFLNNWKGKLDESRISSTAKRTLIGLIKNPNKGNVNIDGMKVTTKPSGNGIIFTLPANDFEISMALTDISDSMGYTFDTKTNKQHMTFEVKPR